jgi:hypothetical protein
MLTRGARERLEAADSGIAPVDFRAGQQRHFGRVGR